MSVMGSSPKSETDKNTNKQKKTFKVMGFSKFIVKSVLICRQSK